MALHSLTDLNNETLNIITEIIKNNYHIDPDIYSENNYVFIAKLVDNNNPNVWVVIKTFQDDHKRTFTRLLTPTCIRYMSEEDVLRLKRVWYNAYDDVYADSKEEAFDARNKHYADVLGLDSVENNIYSLADKVAAHISRYLNGVG